jgi:two-component system chemotaxis sensor kinase CheA
MSIDMSQFHQTFFEESFEGLDIMETELLNLNPGDADLEVINTIFRAAHSIKGGSGTFGFTAVASFTHVMETLLDSMRDGSFSVTQIAVDLLLKSVDCLRDMLKAVRDGSELDAANVTHLQESLEALLKNSDAPPAQAPADSIEDNEAYVTSWRIKFKPEESLYATGNDPIRMFRALEELGAISVEADIEKLADFSSYNPENASIDWLITLTGDTTEEDIKEVFEWVEDECTLEIYPLSVIDNENTAGSSEDNTASAASASSTTVSAGSNNTNSSTRSSKSSSESTSIRVNIDKVDEIINLVGELVITQSMLGQIGEECENDVEMTSQRLEKLREGLTQLERNTRELQESVMRIRMLPISFAFNRVPRMVHDLSAKLDKQVELVISGESTELDKTVLEKIGDPLVHLVRNSLDHGIETPEVRVEAGKQATGKLFLNAYHKGGNIIIEIADDGAGLNEERIREKAIENGLISADDNLSDAQLHDLIFNPGFSTAQVVSDVSGRGVGMDVVRRNIRELGGNIQVESTPGIGSKFSISLPLTLAILDGQLVNVGNETYIVPLVSIIESLQIKAESINTLAQKGELYKLRNEYIPIIRIHQIFGIPTQHTELEGGLLVVVEGDGKRVGLLVDELQAQQQVVIKSLEVNYKRVNGLSGATILGDGTVAMILDVSGIIDTFQNGTPTKNSTSQKKIDTAAA